LYCNVIDAPTARVTFDTVRAGQQVTGLVNHIITRKGVEPQVHVDLSYSLRAIMAGDDISTDAAVLSHLPQYFPIGSRVAVTVKSVNTQEREVALSLRGALPTLSAEVAATIAAAAEKRAAHQAHVAANAANLPQAGQVLHGTITKLESGHGATVQLAAPHDKLHGRVHFMDISDDWVVDPLAALEEKQAVKVIARHDKHIDEYDLRVTMMNAYPASNE
jgi:ribosomal protein S1